MLINKTNSPINSNTPFCHVFCKIFNDSVYSKRLLGSAKAGTNVDLFVSGFYNNHMGRNYSYKSDFVWTDLEPDPESASSSKFACVQVSTLFQTNVN